MNSFNPLWEDEIYGKGNQLNKYPYDNIVSFIFSTIPCNIKRSEINILEIGCGAGNNLWFAAREGFSVTGIDGSKSAIDFCNRRFLQDNLNGNFIVGDFVEIPLEKDTIDFVIEREALVCCNFQNAKLAVEEAYRVLKPNGKIFLNLYSQAHSSFISGKIQKNGMVKDISEGTLVGVGDLCFYSYQNILELLSSKWAIQNIIHKDYRVVTHANQTNHAEWEVTAQKI